jgi:hypothetical protein
MSTVSLIKELLSKCIQHDLAEQQDTLINIMDSVLYHDASPAFAREQLDELWADIDVEIELLSVPPDAEEISLLNPTFNVD